MSIQLIEAPPEETTIVSYELPLAVRETAVLRFGAKDEEIDALWAELKRYFVLSREPVMFPW